MSDFLKARYEKDPSVVYREIAGEAILVPIRRNVADMDSLYALDGIGVRIWSLLDGQRTMAEIHESLLDEYEVKAEVLEADLADFIKQLTAIQAIKAV
jgi:hypothetical protein